MNLGRVWTEPGMVRAIRRAQLSNGRHLVAHLAAFRCPDCEHDHVIDLVNDQPWDLDATDYIDDGPYYIAVSRR